MQQQLYVDTNVSEENIVSIFRGPEWRIRERQRILTEDTKISSLLRLG